MNVFLVIFHIFECIENIENKNLLFKFFFENSCLCFFLLLWEAVSSDGENLIIEVIYE